MPLKAPESYELDRSDSPFMNKHSLDEESDFSEVDEFDPLRSSERPYTDDASQRIRSVFDSEKRDGVSKRPLAWLDGQRRRGGLQRWLIPSRFCCILILLFVATFVLLLSAGGDMGLQSFCAGLWSIGAMVSFSKGRHGQDVERRIQEGR